MIITVKLFATYRDGRFKVEERDYPTGTTCAAIAAAVGLDPAGIGIILVNGRHAEAEGRHSRPLSARRRRLKMDALHDDLYARSSAG